MHTHPECISYPYWRVFWILMRERQRWMWIKKRIDKISIWFFCCWRIVNESGLNRLCVAFRLGLMEKISRVHTFIQPSTQTSFVFCSGTMVSFQYIFEMIFFFKMLIIHTNTYSRPEINNGTRWGYSCVFISYFNQTARYIYGFFLFDSSN